MPPASIVSARPFACFVCENGDASSTNAPTVAAASSDASQHCGNSFRSAAAEQLRPQLEDRRPQQRHLRLERSPDGGRETGWCVHHQIEHEGPATQLELLLLTRQLGDGPLHLCRRRCPHAVAAVQHPIHRGIADTGAQRDLAKRNRLPTHSRQLRALRVF